ncbi:ROK family protein [candidate division KSB1 bacterium]|nr:ROK family protein [candidate division KSB1 bacterium]RQW08035.1 MAG: ROK family protein [candidate division KSB1 bacterium]
MNDLFFGIDIGGTTVNVGVVTSEGQVLVEQKIPSTVEQGAAVVLTRIADTANKCREIVGNDRSIVAAGIGVAGLVDGKNGLLHQATNFPGWMDVPLTAKLTGILKLPVAMDNDANVAALGEYTFGAGRGFPHMMMVTLGTGVGAGLVLGGQIYRGAHGAAGEFGHITIDKNGPRCACGRAGCVEAYVGTNGILRRVRELLPQFPDSGLASCDLGSLTPKDIHRQACAGDALAQLVFHDAGESLGYGLGSVVNLLDIQRIVLGGGVAAAGDFIIKSAQNILNKVALNSGQTVEIVQAELGELAGIVGAASLAMSLT